MNIYKKLSSKMVQEDTTDLEQFILFISFWMVFTPILVLLIIYAYWLIPVFGVILAIPVFMK